MSTTTTTLKLSKKLKFKYAPHKSNKNKNMNNITDDQNQPKRKRIYADQQCSNPSTKLNNPKPNTSQRSKWAKDKDATTQITTRTRSTPHKHNSKDKIGDRKSMTRTKEAHNTGNAHSVKFLDQTRNNASVKNKKSLVSEVVDQRPKKKRKRGIRIHPLDISNKRLDDTDESEKEKRVNLEKNVEMSKNAQFRAIQPSPSILSFVEENLLGRRRLIELRRAGYNINLSAPLDNIPSSETSERMNIEENIFRNKMTFFAAAKVSSSFPAHDLPEVAFAGRSNVGKSSLLNALTRQWGVARTSDKPGLTQSINFFELGSKLCLVDLPGYGYAYAKEEVKDAWEDLVKEYVSTRTGLKQVCLLVDTKWGLKPRDRELIELMERSETKYQIVLTKTDIVFPIDVARRAMQIEESLKANKSIVQPLMMVSSKTGAGVRSLRTVLAKIARFTKLKA